MPGLTKLGTAIEKPARFVQGPAGALQSPQGLGERKLRWGYNFIGDTFFQKLSGGYGSGCIILYTFLNASNIHSETPVRSRSACGLSPPWKHIFPECMGPCKGSGAAGKDSRAGGTLQGLQMRQCPMNAGARS